MKRTLRTVLLVSPLLFACGLADAAASSVSLTAVVSDRGIDSFPRDGIFDGVFGNPSVTQITTPPVGDISSEERTAIEFAVGAIPMGSVIDLVTLEISPQSGANIGLSAGEVGEVHGYTGDGAIQVGDLMVSNLVGSITGPSPDGPVLVPLLASWLQTEIDAASPFAGLMFKGADGPTPVLFSFAGTFSGIPEAQRPKLFVEYHAGDSLPIPEPGTLALLGTGLAALARKRAIRPARGWRALSRGLRVADRSGRRTMLRT